MITEKGSNGLAKAIVIRHAYGRTMNELLHKLSHRKFQVTKVNNGCQPYNKANNKSEYCMYPNFWQHFLMQGMDITAQKIC
jgi:hypothetical protein